jgi:hypothetical protein
MSKESTRKLLKKMRSEMKEYDQIEKEAQKYFSNGLMTKLEFKSVKDKLNQLRFENQVLQDQMEQFIGEDK